MKATLLLLAPAALLVSCTPSQNDAGMPVAPAANTGNPYGVPDAAGYVPQGAPYQPVDAINPPAVPSAPAPPTYTTPVTPPPATLNGDAHTIQKGDTLWGLSQKYGTSVESIKQANGMTSDTIIEGRRLVIPNR